jgi:hypothetical protein
VIEVPAEQTREGFLLGVISGVVASLEELFDPSEWIGDTAMIQAREAVQQTVRAGRDLGVTLTLPGGSGAGLQGARVPVPSVPLAPTVATLLGLLNSLVGAILARGFGGLIVPVNNLDTLSETQAAQFLSAARDITMGQYSPNIHWVFIAGSDLFQMLETESAYRRVSEAFTNNPVSLGPLSWDDVAAALERRRAHFAIQPDTPLPMSMTLAREIYDAGNGELRFTMARLSRTVREFATAFPSERAVPDHHARLLLSEWGHTQLRDASVTPAEQRVVAHLRQHGSVRPREYRDLGFASSQRLSQVLSRLAEKRYVEGGRRDPYRLTPAARFAGMSQAS